MVHLSSEERSAFEKKIVENYGIKQREFRNVPDVGTTAVGRMPRTTASFAASVASPTEINFSSAEFAWANRKDLKLLVIAAAITVKDWTEEFEHFSSAQQNECQPATRNARLYAAIRNAEC